MILIVIEDGVGTPMKMHDALAHSLRKMTVGQSFKVEDRHSIRVALGVVAKRLGVKIQTKIDPDDKYSRRVWLVANSRD